ncbi:uncharacterized protein LOC113226004 isoform X2 [Hyposmocoma kahamanoa]|uniref:uncharacterized protein LOC113226004 isoform X2 n=1 Tax=Hyposmocoma kahamanoa TaxID=1477025 RepID=UPI000E6D617B|nr:uncharacterized protein LOC113226004 isoform X2 [Hyposmocoma kahamanoa]
MTSSFEVLEDRLVTGMIIPVSNETYFNTKWKPKKQPLCAYDMLYHPPDYDPKMARADRQSPEIIRKNIWNQEFHKPISSTNHFQYGRPYWPILDKPEKNHVKVEEHESSRNIEATLQKIFFN